MLRENGYEELEQVVLDHVWSAIWFKRDENAPVKAVVVETKPIEFKSVDFDKKLVVPPAELEKMFTRHKKAREFFQTLPVNNQKEFVSWIEGAKREDTKIRRSEATVEKLLAGKKNPTEK